MSKVTGNWIDQMSANTSAYLEWDGTQWNPSSRRHFGALAADPSPTPVAADGDAYYNTAIDMEMRYDATRAKWLSAESCLIAFGRNGNTGANSYYLGTGGRAFSSTDGRYAEFNGTVLSIAYTRTDTDSATFEVTADGTGIATLASTAVAGKATNLNANFSANAVLGVKNQTGGSTTSNVHGYVRIKWRA